MRIEVCGAGPPLVLLHGWAMHGGVFAPLLVRLAQHHELHLVDLPGHGHSADSDTPLALEAVVEALSRRVPRATWLGWSLGGLFALHAAATRPQALRGLVMLCASPRFVRGDGVGADAWRHGMSAEILRDFATGLRHDYRATLDRFVALEAFGSDDVRGELRTLRAGLFARAEPAAPVLAEGLALLQHCDLRDTLPSLAVPSLWLAGRRDRLVDPRAMRAAAALAPRAEFHVVEHAGHAPFLTHAEAVAARLQVFLDSAVVVGAASAATRGEALGVVAAEAAPTGEDAR